MRSARILHIADVHLGNGNAGAEGPEAIAFARAMDLAISSDLDGILIAGDLFDHGRVPEELLAWTARELDRTGLPVVLMVGNHDVLSDDSVHHRFRGPERCAHVALLDDPDGSVVPLEGTDVVVWGRAMREHQPCYRPLAGIPPRPSGSWGIVAGHGVLIRGTRRTHHGSPIHLEEIAAVDWDYLALGHHHAFMVLREAPRPAVYPGATAYSRHGEAGAVIVTFDVEGASYEWRSLGTV